MKALLFPIILLSLSACSATEENVSTIPAGFVERRLVFKQYKYSPAPPCVVRFAVPIDYDTGFNWVDYSDNTEGNQPKYRFTNARGCLLRETGWIKKKGSYCQDTLDRLTVMPHRIDGPYLSTMDLEQEARRINSHDSLFYKNKPVWKTKKRVKINGYSFNILSRYGPREWIDEPYAHLSAETEFRQAHQWWTISFLFECKKKDCRNFDERPLTTLRSILIDTTVNIQQPVILP